MYGQDDLRAEAEHYVCTPGACEQRRFWLQRRHGRQVLTICVSCHKQDLMGVQLTGQRPLDANAVFLCHCGQNQFELRDVGNEIYTRCPGCGQSELLGMNAPQFTQA